MTWKKSLLLTCKILGLLFITLAADEKYALLKKDNLTIPIQMQLSLKQKNLSQFFAAFLKATLNVKYFEIKTTLLDFVFPKLRTPETWSDKCLKSPVSDIPSTSNMGNVPKQSWNLHHSTFIIFVDQCQVNSVGERLSY